MVARVDGVELSVGLLGAGTAEGITVENEPPVSTVLDALVAEPGGTGARPHLAAALTTTSGQSWEVEVSGLAADASTGLTVEEVSTVLRPWAPCGVHVATVGVLPEERDALPEDASGRAAASPSFA